MPCSLTLLANGGSARVRAAVLGTCLVLLIATPALAAEGAGSGRVTLTLAEYERLWERAQHPPQPPTPPPVEALVQHAEIEVRVEGGLARGALRLRGEVLRSGAVRVPLVSGVLLSGARTASGRPLALVRDGQAHAAVLSGPGPFALVLDWLTPLNREAGRANLTLPQVPAGSVTAVLDLPGEHTSVSLDGGLTTSRQTVQGRTRVAAALPAQRATRVSWSTREGAAEPTAGELQFNAHLLTLAVLGEAELQLTTLVDVKVLSGRAERLELELPPGYELTGVSGPTLESSQLDGRRLAVVPSAPESRHLRFVVGLTRATAGESYRCEPGFVSLPAARRETGEWGVLTAGTLELQAEPGGTLKRVDPSEVAASFAPLVNEPLAAAFRYHRRTGEGPSLVLEVQRFPAAEVLAALAERAEATTLVTAEGRALTELRLSVRNQAQPFVRVWLPEGGMLLSAEVAGQPVKPLQGEGGPRVPLLRAGVRPSGAYDVSLVYLQPRVAGAGPHEGRLSLARLDLPLARLEWEVLLPERWRIKRFTGDLEPAERALFEERTEWKGSRSVDELHGVAGGVPGGVVGGRLDAPEKIAEQSVDAAPASPVPAAALTDTGKSEDRRRQELSAQLSSLQRRAAGVLPVKLDVPRSGSAYRFTRALVLDEESTLSFHYQPLADRGNR